MPCISRRINTTVAKREFIDKVAFFLNIIIPTILKTKKKSVELQKIVFILRFCFTTSPPFEVSIS